MIAFLLVLCFKHILSQIPFTLGNNLVINSQFSTPIVSAPNLYSYGSSTISGWNCTSICDIESIPRNCNSYLLNCNIPSSYSQAIDLNSNGVFEYVSQNILIEGEGNYLLSVTWLAPLFSPIGKQFGIFINNTLIKNVTV